ncbi:MAG: hypothetical protein M3304_08235 [Actinomycetota bacterium]|nr:hypothetical protein [Actinomycetota bacterium]
MTREADDGSSLVEPLAVWALFGVVAVAVAVTYARLPPDVLFNVREDGVGAGLGRTLVFLNFPTALVAMALVAFAADRIATRVARALAIAAVALCLVVAVPGVVEQDDLDAKPANIVPALGVALAFALTIAAWRRTGAGAPPGRLPGDPIRVAVALALVLAAAPWIAAEIGVYAGLGGVFMAGEVVPEPGHPGLRAVHLGHHHGLDGVLLALSALALSREVGRLRARRLRVMLAFYLGLMLVYGLANALQDFWLEQLYKRGATSFRFPSMLQPDLSSAWLGILLATAAVYALVGRPVALRRREL